MTANGTGTPARMLGKNVALHVVAYHAAVVIALVALARLWPGLLREAPAAAVGLGPLGVTGPAPAITPSASGAAVAMIGAVILALPVAWAYVLTRAKRGYQQSVVQTLVVLPMVVAGVVALVKGSLPLAFGLAGIVAAVRFRTALDDSKDAVYVFLATAIGLAAAVDLQVAVVVSTLFNLVVLALWQTDFGRAPAALDGRLAERRLRRAMEQLSRTGTFVARMDDEVFQHMPAEQLQAVADRAWRRARRNNPEPPDPEGRREALLRIHVGDAPDVRQAVDPLLEQHFKRWRFGGKVRGADGSAVLEYIVLLRKGSSPDDVLAALQDAGGTSGVIGAELE